MGRGRRATHGNSRAGCGGTRPRAPALATMATLALPAAGALPWLPAWLGGAPGSDGLAIETVYTSKNHFGEGYLAAILDAGPEAVTPRAAPGGGWRLVIRGVEAARITVPVNVVLLGFRGDGNAAERLSVDEEETAAWLEALDVDRPHVRVERGEGAGAVGDRAVARGSPVHLNFTVHAVNLGSRATGVIERLIAAASRPDDPEAPPTARQTYQVDRHELARALDSLTDELRLGEHGYTIFVANVHRQRGMPRYGYRSGPSPSEVEALLDNDLLAQARSELLSEASEVVRLGAAGDKTRDPLAPPSFFNAHLRDRPAPKLQTRDLQFEASAWAAAHEKDVERMERARVQSQMESDPDPLSAVSSVAAAVLTGKHGDAAAEGLAQAMVERARAGGGSTESVEGAPSLSECLTDVVFGEKRWMWIDLTAGPFSWGPLDPERASALRSTGSLPSVETILGEGAKSRDPREAAHEAMLLEQELESMTESRFAEVESVDAHDLELMAAELDVYEQFARRHCNGWKTAPPTCVQLHKRVEAMEREYASLKSELASAPRDSHLHKAVDPLRFKRVRALDLFGVGRKAQRAMHGRATLLSRVGATVSHALRHVVAPPTATGGRLGYYDQAHIHLYLIEQPGLPMVLRATAEREVEAVQRALESLSLPAQAFQVTIHKLSLADDPVLAVAYSASLRSANVPAPGGPDDDSAVAPRHYLDTAALRKQLSAVDEAARSPASSDARARAIHRRTAEIPVFLFALDMDHPVFVDNTDHTAMAVGDMVIGVQSSAGIVPTGLACGGQRVASDVGRPAKALVAATIEQLSGLLPPHVSAPVLGSDVEEDWLWATASGAMGALSPESDVYEVHRDAVRRAAMIHEIEDAVAAANEAYDTLDALPRHSTHAFAPGALVRAYRETLEGIASVGKAAGELDWEGAARAVAPLRAAVAALRARVAEVAEAADPAACMRRKRLVLGWPALLGLASAGVALTILCLLRSKPHKAHIN